MSVEATRAAVEEAGKRHWAAVCAADTASLDQLLADDLVYTHSDGSTDDKPAYLARVSAGEYATMTVDHTVDYFIHLSDDLAIARCSDIANSTGEVHGVTMNGLEASSLDVWARRDGRWQLVGHQTTLVMIGGNWRKAFEAGLAAAR
jgi:hypothetical protein